jgi:osmotically-inducible protein OsmY
MLNIKTLMLKALLSVAVLLYCSTTQANLQENIKNQGVENNVEIRMLLKRDVPSKNIDAHVNKNILQLSGFVDNKEQFRNSVTVAEKYKDQYKVINNIIIIPSKTAHSEDLKLKEDVMDKLRENEYPVDNIDVQVRNGHVMLSGFVNKHISLKNIKSVSESVPGVNVVYNYLLYQQS